MQKSAKAIKEMTQKESKKKFPKLKVNMTQMPNTSYE
jgi:hypothetical protein